MRKILIIVLIFLLVGCQPKEITKEEAEEIGMNALADQFIENSKWSNAKWSNRGIENLHRFMNDTRELEHGAAWRFIGEAQAIKGWKLVKDNFEQGLVKLIVEGEKTNAYIKFGENTYVGFKWKKPEGKKLNTIKDQGIETDLNEISSQLHSIEADVENSEMIINIDARNMEWGGDVDNTDVFVGKGSKDPGFTPEQASLKWWWLDDNVDKPITELWMRVNENGEDIVIKFYREGDEILYNRYVME